MKQKTDPEKNQFPRVRQIDKNTETTSIVLGAITSKKLKENLALNSNYRKLVHYTAKDGAIGQEQLIYMTTRQSERFYLDVDLPPE